MNYAVGRQYAKVVVNCEHVVVNADSRFRGALLLHTSGFMQVGRMIVKVGAVIANNTTGKQKNAVIVRTRF